MGTRPQTMYGLNDSPVFLAAYLLDHDPISYPTLIRPAFVDGVEGGLTRDDMLDNITVFWLTNTGVSSSKSYWEYLSYGSFANVRNVTVPVAVSVFPDELFQAPRSWTEQAYPNLIHYNRSSRGGHFAAWEQPELYASELRAGSARFASVDRCRVGICPRSAARPSGSTPSHSAPPSCGVTSSSSTPGR